MTDNAEIYKRIAIECAYMAAVKGLNIDKEDGNELLAAMHSAEEFVNELYERYEAE